MCVCETRKSEVRNDTLRSIPRGVFIPFYFKHGKKIMPTVLLMCYDFWLYVCRPFHEKKPHTKKTYRIINSIFDPRRTVKYNEGNLFPQVIFLSAFFLCFSLNSAGAAFFLQHIRKYSLLFKTHNIFH